MAGWKLFMTERTKWSRRSLRRYASGSKCTVRSYHDASVVIDKQIEVPPEKQGGFLKDEYASDSRWPKVCPCGYEFKNDDEWQVNVNALYSGSLDGELYPLRVMPPGAVWEAPWFDHERYRGPDGKTWCVMMPGGHEWIIYGPSSDGKPWQVTGTLPNITVAPSIGLRGHYHGFIRNGVITEDADGRKFEGVPRTA